MLQPVHRCEERSTAAASSRLWPLGLYTIMVPHLEPDLAAPLIKAAGYDGIEWRIARVPAAFLDEAPSFTRNNRCTLAPDVASARRGRKLAEEHGLAVVGAAGYVALGDIDELKTVLAAAAAAGAPQLRLQAPRLDNRPYNVLLEESADFYEQAVRLVPAYGVRLALQIHQYTICPSASLTHRLVSRFDPQWLGVVFDPGNMAREGFEDYRIGLNLLGEYVTHVHLKNVRYHRPPNGGVWVPEWAPLEDGVVDFGAVFVALQASGYRGWLSVSDFSAFRGDEEALIFNARFLDRALTEFASTGKDHAATSTSGQA